MAKKGTTYVQKPYAQYPKVKGKTNAQMALNIEQTFQANQPQYQAAYTEMVSQGLSTPNANIQSQFPGVQVWRAGVSKSGGPMGAGMNLGAMGTLPPLNIITIDMHTEFYVLLEMQARSMRTNLTETIILDQIKKILYTQLQSKLFQAIAQFVPKDSGRLRNMMQLSVSGGATGGPSSSTSQLHSLHPFYVVLSTGNISYAPVVNGMPTEWLQHFGFSHQGTLSKRYGRTVKADYAKGGHHLYDPTAEKNWYEKCYLAGVAEATILWQRVIYELGSFLFNKGLTQNVGGLNPLANMAPDQLVSNLLEVTIG